MTPNQQCLYDALTDIDQHFISEAISVPRSRFAVLKRIAAVAAVLAIIIGCVHFWPQTANEPIFSVTVKASDELDTTITITADRVPEYEPNSGHIKDSLSKSWRDLDLFTIRVELDGVSDEYLSSAYAVIEYDNLQYNESADTDQLAIRLPKSHANGVLCEIYGWAEDVYVGKLNFTLQIYHADSNVETLLYDQPFEIYYSNGHLGINGKYGDATDAVSWSVNLLSTEELVSMIAEDEKPFNSFVYSNFSQAREDMLNHYAHVLAVLDTRDDAGSVILKRLTDFNEMDKEEFQADWVNNMNRISNLRNLLEEKYLSQLTDDELEVFEKLDFNKFSEA